MHFLSYWHKENTMTIHLPEKSVIGGLICWQKSLSTEAKIKFCRWWWPRKIKRAAAEELPKVADQFLISWIVLQRHAGSGIYSIYVSFIDFADWQTSSYENQIQKWFFPCAITEISQQLDKLYKKTHQLVGQYETRRHSFIPQLSFAITCSENVRALPCIDLHWRIDSDNNTTPAVYVMHRSI